MHQPYYIADANAGSQEAIRLKLQYSIFGPNTEIYLKPLIKPNQIVLVVGCGTGEELVFIAKELNHTGKVIGVDINQAQLQEAAKYVAQVGLTNVELVRMNLLDLGNYPMQFDLIVDRFVIGNLPDPKAAIKILVTKLQTDGILYCEEPIFDKLYSNVHSEAFDTHVRLFHQFASNVGINLNLGSDVEGLFMDANLQQIKVHFSQALMQSREHKQIISLAVKACSQAYLEHKLISQAELEKLLIQLDHEVIYNSECIIGQVGVCHAIGVSKC